MLITFSKRDKGAVSLFTCGKLEWCRESREYRCLPSPSSSRQRLITAALQDSVCRIELVGAARSPTRRRVPAHVVLAHLVENVVHLCSRGRFGVRPQRRKSPRPLRKLRFEKLGTCAAWPGVTGNACSRFASSSTMSCHATQSATLIPRQSGIGAI